MDDGIGVEISVNGLPADDWPGHDKPGRTWGIGSRVEWLGEVWRVTGAQQRRDGGWMISLRGLKKRNQTAVVQEEDLDHEQA